MYIIRLGNDINVTWALLGRNGMKYSLEGKLVQIWLSSGPFKKQVEAYNVQDRNEVTFNIDALDLTRQGVYKLLLRVRDLESLADDAAYDLTETFQVVSRSYPVDHALDGAVDIRYQSILNNVYVSTLEGASAYDIAVRHGYEGTEEEWVESHESLPGRVAVLEMNGSQFTLTATPQVIFKDSGAQVAVTAHASGPAAAGIDEIGLYMNGAKVSSVEESDTLTYSTQLLDTTALRADFSHAGIVKQVSAQVTAVGRIYYGSGPDAADFDTHKTAYPNPVTSPARSYNVAVRNDGDHVFFKVPSTMNIARVTLGGFDFPVTLVSTEGGKLYMSDNTYLAGTLTLVVS